MNKKKSLFRPLPRVLAMVLLVAFATLWSGTICAEEIHIGLIYNTQQFQDLKKGKDDQSRYRIAIETNGGKAIILSAEEQAAMTELKLKNLDGLLLPGGDDVNPSRYGEQPHPKLEDVDDRLDEFEYQLLQKAVEKSIPILGICRGEQILNVFFGGSLYQDLPSQHEGSNNVVHRIKKNGEAQRCFHAIMVGPDSRYVRFFGNSELIVNSYHHQAVKVPGQGLKVTGATFDGVVEMIEGTGKQFIVGVQFHPEKMLKENKAFNVFFKTFIEAAQMSHYENLLKFR